jgi:hypothetical protein
MGDSFKKCVFIDRRQFIIDEYRIFFIGIESVSR